MRKNGADGEISVELHAVDETAIAGTNYSFDEPIVLQFAHHSTEASFSIPLIDTVGRRAGGLAGVAPPV